MLVLLQTTYLKVVLKQFKIAKYNFITISIDNSLSNPIIPSFYDGQALFGTLFWC